MSADVDFMALAEAAVSGSYGVEVHGPVEQGGWLKSMGVEERVAMLERCTEQGDEGEKKKSDMRAALERLVGTAPGGMGKMYKVMAVVPERGGRKPVGFGGDVVEGYDD